MKFKSGDLVKVYGSVHGFIDTNYKAIVWYLSKGLKAQVLYANPESDEIEVQFEDYTMTKSRSLNNIILSVHPKQCRKLKKKGLA